MQRIARLLLTTLALAAMSPSARALELEECRISAGPASPSIRARCGRMERPLDADDPESETIALRVVVVPALNLKPEPDPIVPLAGGPGQGAVQFYAIYRDAFEYVRRNRDILLVDQRGTGESARMDCPVEDELIEGQFSVAETVRYMKECLESLPHDPRFFTTSVAVHDLEAVRAALGYPAVNLYGVSYGSRVAQHYARRYPGQTRTVTLDGVVPPQLALGPNIAIEAQRALDNIFDRCAIEPDCAERFPDIADTFQRLRRRLESRAASVELAHPVTGRFETVSFGHLELAGAIRLLAYQPSTIAMIPLLVSEAAAGRFEPLAAQYLLTMTSLSESLALGMHNAVMCSEDVPLYGELDIDTRALNASYIGAVQLEALEAICSVWPQGPVDDDFKVPLSNGIPTLLLSGSADPITPPAYADVAARDLRRAWLLTQQHQGHGQLPVGCLPRLFDKFVSLASLDGVDLRCREKAFVMPFFVDFTGPAP